MRLSRLILACFFGFYFSCGSQALAQNLDPLIAAQGIWELDPNDNTDVGDYKCDKDPMTITIDISEMRYRSIHDEYVSNASITKVGDTYFWIEYDDEERLDNSGNPVSWAFVLENRNQFFWIRNDWLDGDTYEGTSMRRRCPESKMQA